MPFIFLGLLFHIPRDHQGTIQLNEELKKHHFFRHIGIYGYQKDFLAKYIKMDQTNLEKLEKLEQLRVIENGFKIKMIEVLHVLQVLIPKKIMRKP